jgi:hypothetical protein
MATPSDVLEFTKEEYEAFLAEEVDRWDGDMTLADFISAFCSGELDDRDPEVSRLAALVGLGQNGH